MNEAIGPKAKRHLQHGNRRKFPKLKHSGKLSGARRPVLALALVWSDGGRGCMYLNDGFFGGGSEGPQCKACRQPILKGQPVTRVEFDGTSRDMSGDYHRGCSKPFASMAQALNMLNRR